MAKRIEKFLISHIFIPISIFCTDHGTNACFRSGGIPSAEASPDVDSLDRRQAADREAEYQWQRNRWRHEKPLRCRDTSGRTGLHVCPIIWSLPYASSLSFTHTKASSPSRHCYNDPLPDGNRHQECCERRSCTSGRCLSFQRQQQPLISQRQGRSILVRVGVPS